MTKKTGISEENLLIKFYIVDKNLLGEYHEAEI